MWNRPKAEAFWGRFLSKAAEADGRGPVSEVFPGMLGELSPVKVDHRMATTVPGLYAVGNTATSGCAMAGAVPASPGRVRGKALTSSTWMGIRAAAAVLEYAKEVPVGRARRSMPRLLSSARSSPPCSGSPASSPSNWCARSRQAIAPVGYSIYKKKERLEEALGLVLEAQEQVARHWPPPIPITWPPPTRPRAMVLCAEMFYRASLARQESRGWHLREDFPERDDSGWLKWILVQDKDGQMRLSTEDVPVHDYPFQP